MIQLEKARGATVVVLREGGLTIFISTVRTGKLWNRKTTLKQYQCVFDVVTTKVVFQVTS